MIPPAHALVLAALLAAPWVADGGDERVAAAWRALEVGGEGEVPRHLEDLVELGEEAALAGLAAMGTADVDGRRLRAWVVRRAGGARCVGGAILGLGDPDEEVRLELARFLGRRDLERAATSARVAALADTARGDPSARVRGAAVRSLGRVDDPLAIRGLDGLLDELPLDDRPDVARELIGNAGARDVVRRRVERAFGPDASDSSGGGLDARSLAILLDGYGEILAQIPGGGLLERERLPLVAGSVHPAPRVRRAAANALERLISRLGVLGDGARADAVLLALLEDGMPARELHRRRAFFALQQGSDPSIAVAAGRTIAASARFSIELEDRDWRVTGLLLAAAGEFAGRDLRAARRAWTEAADVVDGLLRERLDVRSSWRSPWRFGGDLMVGFQNLRALIELWRATGLLAEGAGPGDPRVLSTLRRMHWMQLEAHDRALRVDARASASSLDILLGNPLGPRRLVLTNANAPQWRPQRSHALQLDLGRALSTVITHEVPGFEPVAGVSRELADVLSDPERLPLVRGIPREVAEKVSREISEEWFEERPDEEKILRLHTFRRYLEEELGKEEAAGYPLFFRQRIPSEFALDLSFDLRADGDAVGARELAARMLADLMADGGRGRGEVGELLAARIASSIGASLMDEDRPREAEAEFLRAEKRLSALEETYRDRLAKAGKDGALEAALRGMVEEVRSLRADILLSLAVNANVRQEDPELALAYFERAFALKKTDFMRVLLACYRARSGHGGEARAVLLEVSPSPLLYYNLACTHALLGDTDEALDFLARDFEENHASDRSRARQKRWAVGDPDLASLRDDPRFQRLIRVEGGE